MEQKSIIRNVCSARHGNEISITTRCRASRTTLTAVTDVSVAVAVSISISVAVSVSVTVAMFVAVAVSVAVAALIKAATALCRCLAIKCKTSQPQATGSRTCLAATQPRSQAASQPLSLHGLHGLHCRGAAPGTPPSVSLTQLQSCDGDGDGDFKCVRLVPSAAVKSGTNNSDTARGGGGGGVRQSTWLPH